MNTEISITVTEQQLEKLVADRVAELLSPERIETLAKERIDERVGSLTLEQACEKLQCKTVRTLRGVCARYSIPITKLGHRIEFIKITDIETAQRKYSFRLQSKREKAA